MFYVDRIVCDGVASIDKKEKHKKIMEKKLMYSPEDLCYGLPEEFSILLKYARKLDFMEKPDYDGIKDMFKELLENNKGFLDMNFVGKIKMILKIV